MLKPSLKKVGAGQDGRWSQLSLCFPLLVRLAECHPIKSLVSAEASQALCGVTSCHFPEITPESGNCK